MNDEALVHAQPEVVRIAVQPITGRILYHYAGEIRLPNSGHQSAKQGNAIINHIYPPTRHPPSPPAFRPQSELQQWLPGGSH